LNNTSYCLTNVDFIDVIQVSTGGYLCIGTTPVSNPKGFAMLLDTWFQAIWYSEFPGINGVNALFAQETNDGGFLISGSTIDFNSNTIPWLIKLDQYGSTTTGIDDIKHNKLFQINQINNSFEITQSKGNKLIVYDMLGNVVKSLNNISNKFSIEIFEKQGIYLFALYKDNELLESKKIFNP
jgi:hypothetical protein